jgi:cytochrome P450
MRATFLAKHRSPPGPRGEFFLGTLKEFRKSPQRFLLRVARDYGDVARYRNAFWSTYFFAHPEHIRHILQDNSNNYSKDTFAWRNIRPAFGKGLLTSDGERWRRQRRLMQPAFHQRRLQALATTMTSATAGLMDGWEPIAARGRPVDVSAEMMKLTLEVMGKALFSSDLRAETGTINDAATGILEFFKHQVTASLPLPHWIPTSHARRFRASMSRFHEVVQRIIESRKARSEWPDDLLSMLMSARDEDSGEGMSGEQLHDELITMLFAGYETTATALSWAWYFLSTHPEAAARLRSELRTILAGRPPGYGDLARLDFTRMVVQETMRLLPPVWVATRKAIADDEIGGYVVPANTVVTFSSYVTHRRADLWENPEEFQPERFSPARMSGMPRYSYFPFGGGPRQCIGNNFAMVEAQLILAAVAQRYSLDLVPSHPVEPLPLGILRPRYGLLVTLRRAG